MTQRPTFTGSWRVQVDAPNGTREQALMTFAEDGSVLCSPAPALSQPAAHDGVVFLSTGHGAWATAGAGAAVITYSVLASDGRGQPFGVATIRGQLTLDADGHAFSGAGVRTVVNPQGMTVATNPATVRATRVVAEAPAMSIADARAAVGGA